MSRFWAAGLPIDVAADADGAPRRLAWGGRRHTVAQIVERWRVDAGWWRRRAWREYFTVLTRDGALLLIYHDVVGREWRLQRIYD